MASAAAAVPSSRETTNYARLCRLLLDVGAQALRDTFDAFHAPGNLHVVLAGNGPTLQTLRTRKIINPTQWGQLFPAIPSTVSSATFDITLLMVLLRNLCGLASPITGWDALPAVTDVTLEADIVRVKYYRNIVFAHAEHASVVEATFNNYWQEIGDTLVRLGGVKYRAAIDNLETDCMDPESEAHYRDLLRQWKKDEDNVKDKLDEIETKITDFAKKLDDFAASAISEGKRGNHEEALDACLMCREKHHEDEPLGYYCEKCKVCICDKCGQTRHSSHTKVDIDQAADDHKVNMMGVVEGIKEKIADIEKNMEKTTEAREKSRKKIAKARNSALTSIEELMQTLREHKASTIDKFDVIEETERQSHAAQQEHFQLFVMQLTDAVEDCEAILQRNSTVEILEAEQALIERRKGLQLDTEKINSYKPLLVRYEIDEEAVEKVRCAVLGRVVVSHFTDPLLTLGEGEGLYDLEAGIESEVRVITNDCDGKRCYDEDDEIKVQVLTPSGEVLNRDIKHSEDGEYSVTYTPECAGQHDVMIEVNGQPLTGSPWRVQVSPHEYQFIFAFGSLGIAPGQFYCPSDIAINQVSGDIAVADSNNGRVQLFSSDGNYVKQIGANKLIGPTSVAFNSSGDLLVIASNKIFSFDKSGRFRKIVTSEHLKKPSRLTIAYDDRMVFCDKEDKKVKVLSPDGAKLLLTFSAPDCEEVPWHAVCLQEVFVVSYYQAHCLKVFSGKDGKFLYTIGNGDGSLRAPRGFVIDNFGNLIVCDSVMSDEARLQVLTLDGHFVSTIERKPQNPGYVAISSTGRLFVVDTSRHCIFVFQ